MKNRFPILTFCVAAITVAVQILPGAASELEFDRTAIAQGEWWRFLTAHLTHFDVNHLAWDLVVLLALGWACERGSRASCALALAVASPAISYALWRWQPHLEIYRGLSGLDCALFGLFTGSLSRRDGAVAKTAGLLALIAVLAKSGFELATGSTVFAAGVGYVPVPLAHLVGFFAGLVAAVFPEIRLITFRRRATC